MSTHTAPMAVTSRSALPSRTALLPVPVVRLVGVELRKSFDTRSGMWLLASLGLAAVLTTGAIIAWSPAEQLTYSQFTLAIGVPMTIILPIIAVLSVTSEWSQRSGLATFTLVPHRGKVLTAKAVAAVLVTVPATVAAFSVGALGTLAGATLAGIDPVWDQGWADVGYFALGQTLLLLTGFALGALIRNSSGAIVAYMLYGFVAPGLLAFLALNQEWFADARPWVDAKYNQDAILRGALTGDGWSHLAVTSLVWLVVPMVVAVVNVLRSEVK
ncbi:ABC transporter permease [Nocardioides sp. STR2]|uniref:ABC transporter permease n=1 Tax=Nocardioides pini TaxID=2975053 RepID=A0ABT4CIF6_9ACTN|nr:ABC transporter permease [Nocardioides pini]MCY4728581.1 ABC transporter permease [Nocardioides pini]